MDRTETPTLALEGARHTPLYDLTILGAPISNASIPEALEAASQTTNTLIERTANIGSHTALFFLSRLASVKRCTYSMRAAPTYTSPQQLHTIDEAMRAAITRTCNTILSDDSWLQASLPTRMGGIGVRRMDDLALPAFISSLSATQELVRQINGRPRDDEPHLFSTHSQLSELVKCPDLDIDPSDESVISQRQLDEAACRHRLEALLERSNQVHRARLLAAATPHSGAWLDAIPAESLGLLLLNEAVRVGVALRLGALV